MTPTLPDAPRPSAHGPTAGSPSGDALPAAAAVDGPTAGSPSGDALPAASAADGPTAGAAPALAVTADGPSGRGPTVDGTAPDPDVPPAAGQAGSASGARRPRRAVRRAGTVGTDDDLLVSTLPAMPGQQPDGRVPGAGVDRRAQVVAPDERAVPLRSLDDGDVGWGGGPDTNDDRLARDRPPHW